MGQRITRRQFIWRGAVALAAAAAGRVARAAGALAPTDTAEVFFTRDLSVDGLLSVYARIHQGLVGKVGIKLHTGEPHGPNLLPIELIKGLQAQIPGSSIVECNVLYGGPRQRTETHREALRTNGFDFCPVDILDADGDAMLPVQGMKAFLRRPTPLFGDASYAPGEHLREIAVGSHLLDYDALLVYTHFKGHAMAGYGGSLKNLAVGCASGQTGKRQVHGPGWETGPVFLERMTEAGKGVIDHFGSHIAYINVLMNISEDCDCFVDAAAPTMDDIGILGSTDVLAVEQAAIDLVYAMPEGQQRDVVARIESRGGLHQLETMERLKMGNRRYELIEL
ncbi:MAG: DUF362 domain-containing protein [Deinococcales bacterium]|jgi:hypothetical protein